MKTVGVQFISICDCDVKTLLIKLPTFYEVCLKYFADTSVANKWSAQNCPVIQIFQKLIIWSNNKSIVSMVSLSTTKD